MNNFHRDMLLRKLIVMPLQIMSSIQFLSRQGFAIRGDGDESDSNLHQLLSMKAEEDSNLNGRLKRKENVCTSPEIQNEIIKVIALQVK